MIELDTVDTIAATATAPGESGIGIVRISGRQALAIADKIFVSKGGNRPSQCRGYTVHYGHIVNSVRHPACSVRNTDTPRDGKTGIIDEVLLTVMRAPRSYTREDVVEINCHGGIVAQRAVLELVLKNGCRLAQPGEFTKRAFLNGRIDLSQAEAVLDIIRAKTDSALRIGMQQLDGVLSREIKKIRKWLLNILSVAEAHIDFPEEEIDTAYRTEIAQKIGRIHRELKDILDSSARGRIFRDGISVVICGKPNVGKSSLLNALLKQERSIVTPVAGTTRDTIEEVIDIRGIPIKIVDTAGVIEPRDLIEKEAIRRTRKYIDTADIVILMFDANKRLSAEDGVLMNKLKRKKVIAVLNKIDLKKNIETRRITGRFGYTVEISAKRLENIGALEGAISDCAYRGNISAGGIAQMSNVRHIHNIMKAQRLIGEVKGSLEKALSLEFIAQDVKGALGYLDEILGKKFSEELLDRIFSDFCIGK